MKNNHKNISFILCLFFLFSCAPKIKNFDNYQKQFLTKSSFLPDKEKLAGKPAKIVVFALDEHDNLIAKQTGLGESMANNIENILSKNKLAELVDRKAAIKLEKEIALSEMNKTGSYKGPLVADYAISGSISNAGFTSKYSNGSTYYNPKNGQFISIPPSYTYSSEVSGNIKIYELPSLKVLKNIEMSGKKVRKENVQQSGGLSIGGIQIGGKKLAGATRDDNLVRKAGEDALDNVSVDIKNALAKKGYILEKRTLKNKVIFKISLGSEDGIKHGDKFEISGQYEVQNPITEEVEIERKIITQGSIADLINPKSCWVVIDKKEKASAIRLGDMVKMKYKKSPFKKITKTIKSFAGI